MSEESHFTNCLNTFVINTFAGSGVGVLASLVLYKRVRRPFIFLFAGIAGGLATRNCAPLAKRLRIE